MKNIKEYILENESKVNSKQNFLIRDYIKDKQLKNRLCDFLQFYIDCIEINNAPEDIFTLSKAELKSLFSRTNLQFLYIKLNKYCYPAWKNYNDFYNWLMEHKEDEMEKLKESYDSSNGFWYYRFEVNNKPFYLRTKKSFIKER